MKKIILGLLILMLNINVEALEKEIYYSDYGDYSAFSEFKKDNSELIDVQIEKRYRWYEETEEGKYLLYNEGIEHYDFIDVNDYKITDFSVWQEIMPENVYGRYIESKTSYKVSFAKPINKLYISGLDLKTDKVNLSQIEIYNDNQKIDYSHICGECDNKLNIYEGGVLILELDNYYYLQDLTIKLLGPDINNINSLDILATAPNGNFDNIFGTYSFNNNGENYISIEKKDWVKTEPVYEQVQIYDEVPEVSFLDNVEEINYYRYRDKLYYFYNLNRNYIQGYHSNVEGYIKDELNFKNYYRYRSRDKIEISKEIKITKYNQALEDFITSTTDYKIETNINYLENGIYFVKYITNFKTIIKEVEVDIVENELRQQLNKKEQEYNELLQELENIKEKNNILTRHLEDKMEENNKLSKFVSNSKDENNRLSEQVKSNDNKIDGLMLTLDNYKEENRSIKKLQNQCDSELNDMILKNDDNEKKLKLSNQVNDYLESTILDIEKEEKIGMTNYDYIYFILFGIIILILIIYFLRKMSVKK